MRIRDVVYGTFEIKEPALLELLKCDDITRLKGVSQSGMRYLGNVQRATNYSRFEHSVGVMLLLRRLGANMEEQAAGLLHDSSHTAFSHIVDFVFRRKNEDYAGGLLHKYIESGRLAHILLKHGLDPRRIGEYETNGGFGLLERPIPELCADRLDNGLRYMHYAGLDTKECVKSLSSSGNRIVFLSRDAARKFAYGFLQGTVSEWVNAETGLRAQMLARAIKRGAELHAISYGALHKKGEMEILKALRASKDRQIVNYLKLAGSRLKFRRVRKGGVFVGEKVRYVNPAFVSRGREIRLMSVDAAYRRAVEKEKKMLRKGYRVVLVR